MNASSRPIPRQQLERAQASLNRLIQLAPVVEQMYAHTWGTAWRKQLRHELSDQRADQLHDPRRLLKAIARTDPPLRLFPAHTAAQIEALLPVANDIAHTVGSDWSSDLLAELEETVVALLQAALPRATYVTAAVQGGQVEVWRLVERGVIQHRWWLERDGWSGWHDFDAPPAQAIAAVSYGWGHMEVFVLDERSEVQHRWWLLNDEHPGGHWFGWHTLKPGGRVLGPLSASSREQGHIELLARGLDGGLVHCWRDASGGWSGWHSLEE